jgi:Zn-dependent protease with chaperone function
MGAAAGVAKLPAGQGRLAIARPGPYVVGMATVGNLDFEAYVQAKRAQRPSEKDGREDAHAYAYVSDRTTRKTFQMIKPVELAVEAGVRLLKNVGKNELLGTAVKVGPEQFPRVHRLVQRCAETLGIAPPTVYIKNNPVLNAMTYGTDDDAFVLVHSALVDHLSDEELLSVIGHECGHIHNEHVVYLTAMHYLRTMASVVVRWAAAPAMLALQGWSRRAEVTCDRAALLCSRDLEAATRALAKLALGSTKLYEQFNLEAFLAQYEEGKEGVGKLTEIFASHPWLPKRIKALRAFAESRLYREHVGQEGGIGMDEVDTRVHEIIKVLG